MTTIEDGALKYYLNKAFNLSYLKQDRFKWIDYIRGITILLVVYRHVLIGIERTGVIIPDYMAQANLIFYSFRMPLFFILSGLFISSTLVKKTFAQLVSSKFQLLIYPYFIWVILQITFQIVFSHVTNSERGWRDYTYIFYFPRELDQFWYLPALFNVTIIYTFIKTKFQIPVWGQLIFGLTVYYLSVYFREVSIISDWMEFYLFFALGDAVSSFFFNSKTQKHIKSSLLFLMATPVFVVTQLYYLTYTEEYFITDIAGKTKYIFISIIGCSFMFIVAFAIQNLRRLSFLRIIGYHSLYIYVMHVFAASFIRIILTKVFHIGNPLFLLLSGIILSIPACIVFYNLLIRDSIFWFLFSMKKKHAVSSV